MGIEKDLQALKDKTNPKLVELISKVMNEQWRFCIAWHMDKHSRGQSDDSWDASHLRVNRNKAELEFYKYLGERIPIKQIPQIENHTTFTDAKGRPVELRDFDAKHVVGVQIGSLGHKLWVCIDGISVLRVNAPEIDLTDMREAVNAE